MKRILLLMAIFMATATGVSAKGGPTIGERLGNEQDTIIIRMANGAKMILQLQNIQQLKAFQNYSLDSLMRELNTYVDRVDQMENSNPGSKDMTVTFNTSEAADGSGDEVTVTVQETTPQGEVRKERHEIRINKSFKIDVEVEEDGDNTRVNVDVPNKAERDSTRAARKEENYKATKMGFDLDLGLNAFTSDAADIPDLKPWGSRYVSLNWRLKSRVGGRKSPFLIVSGLEFAFNNYMFEDNIVVEETGNTTFFREVQDVNFQKTKLTHSSVNLPLMALLQFQRENGKDGFMIGAGPFVGYRLGSHTKLKYQEDGRTEKDKTRDSYNLSDLQYGVEGVVGYGSLNLFAKYNMNDLFKDNRGPQTNVVSFGLRLFL
ncbi:PorT family protein [Pontibacter diazotrophicus]|uniref:PorT family protein n=1 Tax=Pontibacter diazotrophicus TaxID=1400979 RepID=A0A3D8LFW8_9BACT|nr:outer membrane beta-barrel protein [Pontibacter diazotrophicus]RDV16283.1 PorT family protein [Pontibacter diazotrophicus]